MTELLTSEPVQHFNSLLDSTVPLLLAEHPSLRHDQSHQSRKWKVSLKHSVLSYVLNSVLCLRNCGQLQADCQEDPDRQAGMNQPPAVRMARIIRPHAPDGIQVIWASSTHSMTANPSAQELLWSMLERRYTFGMSTYLWIEQRSSALSKEPLWYGRICG